MNDPGGCRLTIVRATGSALWQQARQACDEALAQGCSFVLVLGGAEAYADESVLREEDRQRAARFRQAGDRHNFVLGRTLVHHLLRAKSAPLPYRISRGPRGKPFLPDTAAYNLSHSGRWIACAASSREPIGVDVETFARLGDYRDLLPTIAHPVERSCIEQAPAGQGLTLFKRCWTRKEAVLKATGAGLSDALQGIDVRLDEEQPVLDDPPLRLVDLPLGDESVTASLAQAAGTPAVIVMLVLADISFTEKAFLQNTRKQGEFSI